MTTRSVEKVATAYLASGLSVIPVSPNGSKRPAVEWAPFQTSRASVDKIHEWFRKGECGIAIIGGEVSAGLEIIDFDDENV